MKKYLTVIVSVLFLTLTASPVAATEVSYQGKIICLDPGHGGDDGGTYYPYGADEVAIWEKDLNLNIALSLEDLLETNGATVELTRTDDETLSNADRYNFCNGIGADILISIHHNGSTDNTMDGTLGLYHSHKDDKILADYLQKALYGDLKTFPEAGDDWEFIDFGLDRYASGVLLKSDMPAAMMEAAFLTNKYEGPELADTDSDRRQTIVNAYEKGIVDYFANVSGGTDDGEDDNNGGGSTDFCQRKPDHWKCQ